MYQDIGTFCIDRCSEGLSTKTNDLNTLTCQYPGTNNTPWDPLRGPVTTTMLITPKKEVTERFIMNYRRLNQKLVRNPHHLTTGPRRHFTLKSHFLLVKIYFVLAYFQVKRARFPWAFFT